MVGDAGCGITIEPESPSAIVEGIRLLKEKSPEERDAMGRRGYEYVLRYHDYKKLAQQFIDVLTK